MHSRDQLNYTIRNEVFWSSSSPQILWMFQQCCIQMKNVYQTSWQVSCEISPGILVLTSRYPWQKFNIVLSWTTVFSNANPIFQIFLETCSVLVRSDSLWHINSVVKMPMFKYFIGNVLIFIGYHRWGFLEDSFYIWLLRPAQRYLNLR